MNQETPRFSLVCVLAPVPIFGPACANRARGQLKPGDISELTRGLSSCVALPALHYGSVILRVECVLWVCGSRVNHQSDSKFFTWLWKSATSYLTDVDDLQQRAHK
ncbi:hypothetical protein RRG08_014353 [Elysia crispata]|uniref:Uncharacterized protein n=1 Tax=Elysia crispata TaxID=231223 RepID=A0AAE1CJC6_9GAST|nr:hypothetical protein RRG08_014353 [Elysia crispata]